jgi:hypothetical protein
VTTVAEWRERARSAILSLLEHEYAAIWPEIEAKLEPKPGFGNRGKGIDPHHLEYARRDLRDRRIIRETAATTKGSARVSVISLSASGRMRIKTFVDAAAGRKRLLQARYMGWTRPTATRPSLIGRAGEDVVRASLEAAVLAGVPYRLEERSKAGVARLFGGKQDVPGGPLDDAAYFAGFTEDGGLILTALLVEAKNVRHWIYPADWEIFQLLDKAAQLQAQFPDQGFVPILVARRIQYLTFLMAEELGFTHQSSETTQSSVSRGST